MFTIVRNPQLGKKASCHVFRHSMATAMLENGADIRFIQEMLGYAKLTSTQVYTRVSIAKLKAVHTATHPAALLERRGHGRDRDAPADPTPDLADDGTEEQGGQGSLAGRDGHGRPEEVK